MIVAHVMSPVILRSDRCKQNALTPTNRYAAVIMTADI